MDHWVITGHETVTSTSDIALAAAAAGAPEGTGFTARQQTKGRGRRARDWQSPLGNFYLSFILRPSRPKSDWPSLSLIASLALRDGILGFRGGDDVRLKWPNDILYRGGKCAGLLLEVEGDAVVIGCGVNLDAKPDEVDGWAPSLLNDGDGAAITAPELLGAFEAAFIKRYNDWTGNGFAQQKQDWCDASAHLGQRLVVASSAESIEGVFTGLDDFGGLCLAGHPPIHAGDVAGVRTGKEN